MEASDSSHSGMVEVARWWRREGLEGAEVAKRGWRREALWRESKSALRLELRGEERGGVTGALLDILRGGRLAGMEVMLRMNGMRKEEGWFPSMRVGLGNEEEVGLAW